MNLYLKIGLIIFGVAYLISPVDILPDLLLPYIGWLDDGVVLGTLVYLIRYGRLPNFFFKKQSPFKQTSDWKTTDFASNKKSRRTNRTNRESDGKRQASQKVPKTPYDILGIHPNASKKDIQAAYKEAIKKYHPDKLSHLGEEFSDLANKKFIEIQKAYDTLMGK
ncbi:DnaJ domain-containing protein [Desulfobacula sp.]|uniref:DnaJ domain-containing protein n=1 Tax=Desulfobacula sp. TaxID=2593537 RepID=UPI00260AC589|nr:DnaJ domain-containing protein [Desulfobacula sp.]